MFNKQNVIDWLEDVSNRTVGSLFDQTEDTKELALLALAIVRNQPQKPKKERLIPCKCGCKRREHWCYPGSDMPEGLKCMKCGFTARGKNATDVIREWNKAIIEERRKNNEAD